MKVFKFILWFIVMLTMAVSIAFWTVATFVTLVRLTSAFTSEDVLILTVLPILLYSLYMWSTKYSRDLIDKIKR